MGVSFINRLPTKTGLSHFKATHSIISRRDYFILTLIGVLSIVSGAAAAKALSQDTNLPSLNSETTSSFSSGLDRPLSVSNLVLFVRTQSDPHGKLHEKMQTLAQAIDQEERMQKTEVKINDQPVNVPQNGVVDKNIQTHNGNVNVHIESHNSQSGSGNNSDNSSSFEINTDSSSSVQSEVRGEVNVGD